MGIIVPLKISVAVSMPYTGLLFASLAIMLLIDTLILAHHNKDPSMLSIFKWDNIKAAIPGYILTFFAQIAGIYIVLACGFHFTLSLPYSGSLLTMLIPILIGMIISVLLCASINKCVNLYTGNDGRDVIHNPFKGTLDYIYHKITFDFLLLPIFTHGHNSDFHITIPNDITRINDYAFSCYTNLKFITIPDGVTEIGYGAFARCSSLTSITIPNSVTEIGRSAFIDCTSLTSIAIPDGVTKIGAFAFSLCTSLTSITIHDGVTRIGRQAFVGCSSLTSITIPNSVTEIGYGAFAGCSSLTSITIPNSVTEIGKGAFEECTALTNITIPNSVTEIGEGAFWYCSGLISITIHDGVTRIGRNAFAYCTSLTSINIPDSVTEIGYYVFNGCTNLDVIICSDPDQFDWDNLGIDRTRTQVISYQEYLTNNHADLLTATNLIDLNNNEAYLIYRLISEPEFNPSWQVLETTFNERSLPQIRRLLQNIGKDTDHLPKQIIMFEKTKIPPHIEEFLSIADRSSLFGQAQRTIDISLVEQQQVASSQQTPAA